MKIHFLGTNSWYTNSTGNTACVLIDAKDRYIIFDAGNGLYKIDEYIKEDKPISLFISHFHIDHISGLQILLKFDFPQGIDIYVAKGQYKEAIVIYCGRDSYLNTPLRTKGLQLIIQTFEKENNLK